VYGYNWWVNGVKANGMRKWPGSPPQTCAAVGHNNNYLFVIPPWNMVVVRLGLDESPVGFRISDETWGSFLKIIGDSIRH